MEHSSSEQPTRTERRQVVNPTTAPAITRAYLQVLDGPTAGELVLFPEQGEILIGRAPNCSLRLQDSAISWEHARVFLSPTPTVQDVESTNGTLVNGKPCKFMCSLPSGAILRLGGAVHVRYGVQTEREIELAQKLYVGATRDFLTGLVNRAHFFRHLEQEIALSARHGGTFGLLVLDADHFKRINDQHGHTLGDEFLKELAGLFIEQCRLEDVVARYGGEEFVILLRNAQGAGCQDFAERVRSQVEARTFCAASVPLKATISIGGTIYKPGDSTGELIGPRRRSALPF